MPEVGVAVLGRVCVMRDAEEVVVRGRRERAVLSVLVAVRGVWISAERLIEEIWGDAVPATAAAALQVSVSRLRAVLEPERGMGAAPELLVSTNGGYQLRIAAERIDAERFAELVARADLLCATDPAAAKQAADDAAALWRGRPYADASDSDLVRADATRLENLRLTLLEAHAQALLDLGRAAVAAAELESVVAEHPFREGLAQRYALALYRSGRQAEALSVLRRLRAVLAEELGVDPAPASQQLEAALLRQDPALSALPAAAGVPIAAQQSRGRTVPPEAVADGFVGREAELDTLRQFLTAALAGTGPTVALVEGEPGIGKTTLVEHALAATGVPTLWSRSPEHDVAPPLWPWEQVLRQLDAPLPPALTEALSGDTAATWDVAGARLRLFALITELLRDCAPLVVVLDDVHWADTASVRLLAHLSAARPTGLAVVGTFRTHEAGPLADVLPVLARANAARIRLEGLTAPQVRELSRTITGADPGDGEAGELHARSGGNPFFLRQIVGRSGADVPTQLREVLLAQVERLPAQTADLLAVAAVGGPDIDGRAVALVAETGESDALDRLDAAVTAGLLLEDVRGVTSYRFVHALIRDALLSTVPRSRKARLHRRFGEVTAQLWSGSDDHATEIARHWLAAAGLDAATARRAMQEAGRAADLAARRFAPEAAAGLWQDALAAANLARASQEERFPLLIGLAHAHEAAGDLRDMLAVLDAALPLAGGDPARVAEVADAAVGHSIWFPFDYGVRPTTLLDAVTEALAVTERCEQPAIDRVRLLGASAVLHAQCADFDTAARHAVEAVSLARRLGDRGALMRAMHLRILALHGVHRIAEQLAAADELRALPRVPREEVVTADVAAVTPLVMLGRYSEAVSRLEQAAEGAVALRSPSLQVQVLVSRIALAHFEGRFDDEATYRAELADLAARFNLYGAVASQVMHSIAVAIEEGDVARHAEVLESTARDLNLINFLPGLALALHQLGRTDDALELLRDRPPPPPDYTWLAWAGMATVAAIELGARDILARQRTLLEPYREGFCAMGSTVSVLGCVEQLLGEAALALGDAATAERDLRAALRRLEAAGAAYWADRARAALARCALLRSSDVAG